MMRFLERLIPDEPVFPYEPQETPQYAEKLPDAIRYWSYVSIAVNVVTLAVATVILRNLAPTILFAMFTLIPLYFLCFWRDVIKTMNQTVEKQKAHWMRPMMLMP